MTSLTRAKKMTRAIALGAGVAFGLFIIVRVFLGAISLISTDSDNQAINGEMPTLTFGQVAAPVLPTADVSTETATIQLDLVSGSFPQASSTASVYRVAGTTLSLSARDRARASATNLGFTVEPTEPTPSTFKWSQDSRTMLLDLNDHTFSLERTISSISFNNRDSFSRFTPIGSHVSEFIQDQFQYPDLQYATPDVQFVNPSGSGFTPQSANAIQPTNYARATFLRQNINDLPVYSASGKFGPISVVVAPAEFDERGRPPDELQVNQVVELVNNYIPIHRDQSATYPIVGPETAYDTLRNNIDRYLVSVSPINNTNQPSSFIGGRVLFITLAYLEPDDQNRDYVQPVWMFEGRGATDVGDARWIAYVPAINQQLVNSILLN